MVSWVALSVIFLYLLHLSTMEVKTSQPCRSQVRQPPGLNMLGHCKEAADPRVGSLTPRARELCLTWTQRKLLERLIAKILLIVFSAKGPTGEHAEGSRSTVAPWPVEDSSGVGTAQRQPLEAGIARSRPPAKPAWIARPRLRVRSYNAGGLTVETYDYLYDWLVHRCREDIVILQELHWGCGRADNTWAIPGWNFYNSI